jgi:hypothetical protein
VMSSHWSRGLCVARQARRSSGLKSTKHSADSLSQLLQNTVFASNPYSKAHFKTRTALTLEIPVSSQRFSTHLGLAAIQASAYPMGPTGRAWEAPLPP